MNNLIYSTQSEAEKTAEDLSIQNWNRYYHVASRGTMYVVVRNWEEDAVCYYIKGNKTNHLKK